LNCRRIERKTSDDVHFEPQAWQTSLCRIKVTTKTALVGCYRLSWRQFDGASLIEPTVALLAITHRAGCYRLSWRQFDGAALIEPTGHLNHLHIMS